MSYVYRTTEPPEAGEPDVEAARRRLRDPAQLPPGFKPLDPDAPRPADVARLTLRSGAAVDYIVRRERGTLNRAVYEIAFLHSPGEPLPEPGVGTPGWNGRLVYVFGGGCAAGYRQGILAGALHEELLQQGYAVAASSLNVFGNTCDDVISAETAMMVKEHFIEAFGPPLHTIGSGGSGGAMQQYLIAQNYPGILDAITPGVSFSDHLAVVGSSADCALLARFFDSAEPPFLEEQMRAISGFPQWGVCSGRWARATLQRSRCDPAIPEELQYAPGTRPDGARCTIHDNMANAFGRDPATGRVYRPLDNVGVQYGLVALRAGSITLAQFLDLNESIGGHDSDGEIVSARTVADPQALRAAYQGGRLNTGAGSLGWIPIIDYRPYLDPEADIHDSYRSFVTWARIAERTGGRTDHFVMLRTPARPREADGRRAPPPFDPVRLADQWLTDLSADRSTDDRATRVRRARPDALSDGCYTEAGEKIEEPVTEDPESRCNTLYPPYGDPRIAAGAPLTDDVLKCQLRPIDPADYPSGLSPTDRARLERIFPEGVCNYAVPGVAQGGEPEPWLRY